MSSESKLINLDNVSFKILDISAMTVSEKGVLKKRLKSELSQVVSAADHIDAQLKRMQQEREKLKRKLREGEEQPVYEEQLPPAKALHAAMLKSRFADTILKAQQKILLRNGEKGDLAKMQQERAKLKRKLQEGQGEMETESKVFSCCSEHLEEMLEDFGVERIYEKGFYFLL